MVSYEVLHLCYHAPEGQPHRAPQDHPAFSAGTTRVTTIRASCNATISTSPSPSSTGSWARWHPSNEKLEPGEVVKRSNGGHERATVHASWPNGSRPPSSAAAVTAAVSSIRRLLLHPHVELARVASVDFIGEPLSAAHPNLEGLTDLKFSKAIDARRRPRRGWMLCILGLPHKVSATKMPELMASGARVVDLSGDFRLRDAATYKKLLPRRSSLRRHGSPTARSSMACPETQSRENQGRRSTSRRRGASPRRSSSRSCPSRSAGLLDRSAVEVVGITGSSGQRRRTERWNASPSSRGEPPDVQATRSSAHPRDHADAAPTRVRRTSTIRFVPGERAALARHLRDVLRPRRPESASADQIRALYKNAYAREPFVRVPEKRQPEVAAVSRDELRRGRCSGRHRRARSRANASWRASPSTDNLIKGGAGQAIQSMNIMLGVR